MTVTNSILNLTPPVALAPMAGITDLPTRQVVQSFGAGWVVSEMIASHDVVNGRPDARAKSELGYDQANTAVQIAGRDAGLMAEAARIAAANGARIIDINMGCPAKKVTNGWSGSALLREPDHALRLIEAVVQAVDVPVTLKTRLGWDHGSLNAADIARRAEEAGIRAVTIHGRTRCQFYTGAADWAAIRAIQEAVTIPVIANGDILDAASACQALVQSGGQGVMVGRAVRGRPWLLAQIAHELHGTPEPVIPQGSTLAALVARHYDSLLSFYGQTLGPKVARKHLGWYMDHADTPGPLRQMILTAPPATVFRLLPDAFAAPAQVAA
jgi:tRNA-dihydrouridine synthase B